MYKNSHRIGAWFSLITMYDGLILSIHDQEDASHLSFTTYRPISEPVTSDLLSDKIEDRRPKALRLGGHLLSIGIGIPSIAVVSLLIIFSCSFSK